MRSLWCLPRGNHMESHERSSTVLRTDTFFGSQSYCMQVDSTRRQQAMSSSKGESNNASLAYAHEFPHEHVRYHA